MRYTCTEYENKVCLQTQYVVYCGKHCMDMSYTLGNIITMTGIILFPNGVCNCMSVLEYTFTQISDKEQTLNFSINFKKTKVKIILVQIYRNTICNIY